MFKMHGFIKKGKTNEQIYGDCPFCFSESKFYFNKETKAWDCKKCGRKGGFKTFLKEIAKHCKEYFKGKKAKELSKDRKIKIKTLKNHGIGYNPISGKYSIPVYDQSGEIIDIRLYDFEKVISTKGAHIGIWGIHEEQTEKVFLCEGEWDKMALSRYTNHTIFAVPGAGVFKKGWEGYFENKDVILCYDNDDPGKKGSTKVYHRIQNTCRSVRTVHWKDKPKGYDIRDLCIESDKPIKELRKYISKKPLLKKENGSEFNPESLSGEIVDCKDVYDTYSKWLHLESTDTIDVLYGSIIANRIGGDPIWLFLVAPSGGTKSEFITSISDCPGTYSITTLTPHTLISGANFGGGGDPSLIPKLKNKVLAIKDFTTILNMNSNSREEIFGILRDAYDGKIEKNFGNGIIRRYKSKFGIVAGVTPAIELYTSGQTALGERFLKWNIPFDDSFEGRYNILSKALSNTTKEEQMRKEIDEMAYKVLNHPYQDDNIPDVPDNIKGKVIGLSQYIGVIRGTVNRDKYTREVTHKPFQELGTRLAKQFLKLMLGIGLFRQKEIITNREYEIIKKVAISTIPSRLETIVYGIVSEDICDTYTVEELQEISGLPRTTVKRMTENLVLLQVLEELKVGRRLKSYKLKDEIVDIIELSEIYKTRSKKWRKVRKLNR